MKIKDNINEYIFRGYDIRGVYPTELDEDTYYTIGLGFGSYIAKFDKKVCVVGHDNRLSSVSLHDALIKGITETGIDVIDLGLCTTPMYYYACIKLNTYSGMMVTASHNPKDDNGIKFSIDESGNCKGQEIKDFLEFIKLGNFNKGEGKVTKYNTLEEEYLKLFKDSIKMGARRIKAVIDPGNGTTSIIAKKIYEMFPIDLYIINGESDGNFPNHHPDPCVEENLLQLKQKVRELKADVGIAFDGDGDRLGIVTSKEEYIACDKYMIIIIRDLINKVSNKSFLYDIKCSKSLIDEIEQLGAKGICSRTGNSYTKAGVKNNDLPFGGELSGHVYFRDRFLGFDSGLYAGLRLIEILSKTDKNIEELLEGINNYYQTPELKVKSLDSMKFEVIANVEKYAKEKGYKYLTIDGVKVLFDDGWALVRASNTGPNITTRFEASTKERLEEIKNEFMNLVDKLNK